MLRGAVLENRGWQLCGNVVVERAVVVVEWDCFLVGRVMVEDRLVRIFQILMPFLM